ncbi:MAG: type II toxin-antitoxin system RelB/DinJ family antitoxin [Patescibacteria group bacterium]
MIQVPMTIKIDDELKKESQALAKKLGLSLSAIIENKLREVVRDRRVVFEEVLEPTPYLEKIMRQAEKDLKTGKNIVGPLSADEFIDHLKTL